MGRDVNVSVSELGDSYYSLLQCSSLDMSICAVASIISEKTFSSFTLSCYFFLVCYQRTYILFCFFVIGYFSLFCLSLVI